MLHIVLLGTGAGATAALLFASLASGSMLAILLCFLAPLPIMLAALGWNHWAAVIAMAVGAVTITTTFGIFSGLAFLAGVGIPGWLLGYLAMLARPDPASSQLEWYPPGALVFWAALSALLIAAATQFSISSNQDRLREALRPAFEQLLGAGRLPSGDVDRLVETFLLLAPSIAAVTTGAVNIVNLWLAGRIVRASGRLKRPWPDVAALSLPPRAPLLLGAAAAACFLPGAIGWAAATVTAVLLLAFAVAGFAVMHATTRGMNGRPFIIGGAYGSVLMLSGWPMMIFAILGVTDGIFHLRQRAIRRGGPPSLPKP